MSEIDRRARWAGVYQSDVKGHLLLLNLNPTRVTCIPCAATCDRSQFKNKKAFDDAAKIFVDQHGALDRKIAMNIDEVVDFYLKSKITVWADVNGREYVQDAKGNTACITDIFELSSDTIADLET